MVFLSGVWWVDPGLWLGILVGVIGTIAGIAATLWVFRKQRAPKEISYQVISDAPIVSIDRRVEDKVKIIYEDKDNKKEINDARLLILKVWNSGKVDVKLWNSKDPMVKREDYETPIQFRFEGRKVVSLGIETEPPENVIEEENLKDYLAQEPLASIEQEHIELPHCLLKPNQSINLSLLLTGPKGKMVVGGKLVDGKIKEFIPTNRSLSFTFRILSLVMLVLVIGILTNTLSNYFLARQLQSTQLQSTQLQSTQLVIPPEYNGKLIENLDIPCIGCSLKIDLKLTTIAIDTTQQKSTWSFNITNISNSDASLYFTTLALEDNTGQKYEGAGLASTDSWVMNPGQTIQTYATFDVIHGTNYLLNITTDYGSYQTVTITF